MVTSRKYPYEKELLAQKLVKKHKYCFSMWEFDEWEEKGKQFHEKGRNLYDKVTLIRSPQHHLLSPPAPGTR